MRVEESKYFGSEYEVILIPTARKWNSVPTVSGRRSIVNIRPFLRRSFPSRSRISCEDELPRSVYPQDRP